MPPNASIIHASPTAFQTDDDDDKLYLTSPITAACISVMAYKTYNVQ